MASITLTPNKHWLLYPILVAAVCGALWLWRDTTNRDLAALKSAVETAQKAQVLGDKQALDSDKIAQAELAMKNKSLEKQLAAAKTEKAQIDLINQQNQTHIAAPDPKLPDAPIPLTAPDIQQLAVKGTQCAEAQNQIAANQIQIAGDKIQIESRDTTIKKQSDEITSLKGGSHFKRFLKAAKYIGIGAAIGVTTGILIEKQ